MVAKLKILISAHELSPTQGSECALGWNLVTRLAKYHDVTVLYAKGSQFEPESYEKTVKNWLQDASCELQVGHLEYKDNLQPATCNLQLCFVAIPQPPLTLLLASLNRFLSRRKTGIGLPFLYYLGYRLWQKQAYKTALTLMPFDLVHHLNQITFREPGYLWKLGIPFVWGPTGGLEKTPLKFAADLGATAFIKEFIRNTINHLTFNLNPRIKKAIRKSSLIYAFSKKDQLKFKTRGAYNVQILLDAGCEPSNTQHTTHNTKLHILWVGQLIKRKALDILLKAVLEDAELRNKVDITVIGDGPLRLKYEQLSRTLTDNRQLTTDNNNNNHNSERSGDPDSSGPQLEAKRRSRFIGTTTHNSKPITFLGWISRDEVFKYMSSSDLLVHTSYREATSNVIPEAISCGLPVICHDISGMSIAIDETCGIKVPLVDYENSVEGFREAIRVAGCRLQVAGFVQPGTCNSQLEAKRRSRFIGTTTDFHTASLTRATALSWSSMAEQIASDYVKICQTA